MSSDVNKLRELKSLLDAGILTKKEFRIMKQKIINGCNTDMDSSSEEQCASPSQLYKIILCSTSNNTNTKVRTIKIVREATGLGLADSKNLVDSLPQELKRGITLSECQMIEQQLQKLNATTLIEPDTE